MCIKDNQSFRVVENEGFVELLNEAEPRFKMPFRWTIARDCLKIYKVEVLKLKELFVSQRISFTTDTWTSGQNINYMCLTAHWINDEWKLCKKIINFCQIRSHKGVEIGKMILALLRKWDIDHVFTITIDNASSNDLAIGHLKMFLRGRDAILGNKYMHLRCCAHILNLIVKDGLKEQYDSIARIQNAVKYVRSSPARLTKFRTCVEREKIICEKMVCLDVDTRWNSTYLMLEVAMVYEGAFERMIIEDANYENYFKNDDNEGLWDNGKKKKKKIVKGHPNRADFSNVKCFIHFLKLFYDVTMKISGSKYCTSNIFFIELVKVQDAIIKMCANDDLMMRDMARRMKEKYDKYWDNLENTNFLLYVSILLDPRYKKQYLDFCLAKLYGRESMKCSLMCERIMNTLHELFDHYQGITCSTTSNLRSNLDGEWDDDFERYAKEQEQGGMEKSEIDIYLLDGREKRDENFNLLDWWMINSKKFPLLSKIARHVLAMPISTVASESAFSTGGRTLNSYRSRLSTRTAEALICCQDWLRKSEEMINIKEDPEDLKQYEHLEKDELKSVGKLFEQFDLDD